MDTSGDAETAGFKKIEKQKSQSLPSDWATWQLLDSLLPTGGFAHSFGLETAFQAGLIKTPGELKLFIVSTLENTGSLLLPFVFAAHENARCHLMKGEEMRKQELGKQELSGGGGGGSQFDSEENNDKRWQGKSNAIESTNMSDATKRWAAMDSVLQAVMSNHVARRASSSQGTALLRLVVNVYPEETLLKEMRIRSRKGGRISNLKSDHDIEKKKENETEKCEDIPEKGTGGEYNSSFSDEPKPESLQKCDTWDVYVHHAPVFGTVCGLVGISSLVSQRAYLFTALRDMLSAATRLNLIGPLEASSLHRKLTVEGESILSQFANRPLSSAYQTAPVLDLVQGSHDQLFSRLFSS